MRFEGTIQSWNDERGFGFVEAAQGGVPIFVHATAYRGPGRPQPGQRVTFEVVPGRDGKKKALRVEPLRASRPVQRPRDRRPAASPPPATGWIALPALAAIYGALAWKWGVPMWMPATYAIFSVLAFVLYASDKSAARRGAWRTPESTLHLVGVLGGWPGALVAQQLLRHKSAKREFRAMFWTTVVLNVAGFVWLCSRSG